MVGTVGVELWDIDVMARGEALLKEIEETITRMRRAREAALTMGNDLLAEEVQNWMPPLLKTKAHLSMVVRSLSRGRAIQASEEACTLSRYLGRLISVMDLSGHKFVTRGLRVIFVKVYGYSLDVCSSSG
jgi:hypothetical protein